MQRGWIISSNVYSIFEDFGTYQYFPVTPLSLVLYDSWPVVICMVSLFYSCEFSVFPSSPGAAAH